MAWFKSWPVMSCRYAFVCYFSFSLAFPVFEAVWRAEGLEGTCLFDKQMT